MGADPPPTVPGREFLHLDPDPDDAIQVVAELEVAFHDARITTVERLSDALRRLRAGAFDAILLKLDLPDSAGIATLQRLREAAPELPLLVLGDPPREDPDGIALFRNGAQDILPRSLFVAPLLGRAVAAAIERHRFALQVTAKASRIQEAESRIRQIIEATADAMIIVSADGAVRYANPAAERLFGRSSAQLLGHPFGFPIVDGQTTELDIHREDGSWRLAEMRVMETRWCDRPAFVASLRDITNRRQLESELVRAQRMESLGALAAGIAHDLNNVLSPIALAVDLLRRRRSEPELQGQLDILASSVERGSNLARQVLTFARQQEGERVPVDMASVVQEVGGLLANVLQGGIRLRVFTAPGLGLVPGDAAQLRQMLVNLILHARDRSPIGGAPMEISLSALNDTSAPKQNGPAGSLPPGHQVLLTVHDNGPPLSPHELDRLFDPPAPTGPGQPSPDWRMPAVFGIARNHGGTLTAESTAGGGTTIRVHLPAQPGATPSVPAPSPPSAAPPQGNQECILVVDDEASIREMTRYALESYGYRVLTAADGREALAAYEARKPEIHAVLVDLMMPNLDGIATIQALRCMTPSLRIVAASGLTTHTQLDAATRAGCDLFLPKPFGADALLDAIHRALRRAPKSA